MKETATNASASEHSERKKASAIISSAPTKGDVSAPVNTLWGTSVCIAAASAAPSTMKRPMSSRSAARWSTKPLAAP
jgi:hypothetical protein